MKIYYEANGWLSNDDYKTKLKNIIGDDQYSSSYTKKAQMTSYFGFTEWEDIHNARSLRRITAAGKQMYEALCKKDDDAIQELLMRALETVTFGRNNYGCPDSNSDVEPPAVFVRAIIDGYINRVWFLKYYAMLFPEVFPPNYSANAQNTIIDKLALDKSDNTVIRMGIIRNYVDKCEISGVVFSRIFWKYCNNKDDDTEINEDEEIKEEEITMLNCLEKDRSPRTIKVHSLNSIVYGPPGTGKTYSTAEYAQAIVEGVSFAEYRASNPDRKEVMKKYNELVRAGQIVFTTFHQSYGYEEFIQGLRPDTTSDKMNFKIVDGVFKKIADKALNDDENNYVIIIDEINRANISKVFYL